MPPGTRWKNRFISTKFYDKDAGVSIIGQKNKKTSKSDELNENDFKVKRRRVVDLHFLANVMFCSSCKNTLSLDDIDKEYLKERDSINFIISRRCGHCFLSKTVLTWKTHKNRINDALCDMNSKFTYSAPNDVLNHSSVEKFLRTMKVPYMTSKTYVKYEKEVGPIADTDLESNIKEIV